MPEYPNIFERAASRLGQSVGRHLFAATFALVLSTAPGVSAEHSAETSRLCDRAARLAAKSRNVPYDVLQAISRAETGRTAEGRLEPWPWTVNMEGTGKWFASEDEARAYVFRHFKRGARSFDVGCFQVNYKWHGAAFRSIDDMFDPVINADYAAKFLLELYDEFGSWSAAAGAYHSRTQTHARTYAARFDEIRAATAGQRQIPVVAEHAPVRGPSTVFASGAPAPLISGGAARMGSLVPISRTAVSTGRSFVLIN
ncbi:transglycosylase SLT domain-containing protein [Sedimentitalea todarodis]|uniref:Transglycosylase SLT domain-containing protein n=1 Tax=Sedimentitalea todarodis TaxID=1631240 RepID=A0ABU3VKS1_9RHOB|nr:transglycosylase SLT domain-containing protein [Sedimentitalea todarodis]MDU9006580.1 transglycosylase SLT domain-containing protein [Sedimentitalea todarodis]